MTHTASAAASTPTASGFVHPHSFAPMGGEIMCTKCGRTTTEVRAGPVSERLCEAPNPSSVASSPAVVVPSASSTARSPALVAKSAAKTATAHESEEEEEDEDDDVEDDEPMQADASGKGAAEDAAVEDADEDDEEEDEQSSRTITIKTLKGASHEITVLPSLTVRACFPFILLRGSGTRTNLTLVFTPLTPDSGPQNAPRARVRTRRCHRAEACARGQGAAERADAGAGTFSSPIVSFIVLFSVHSHRHFVLAQAAVEAGDTITLTLAAELAVTPPSLTYDDAVTHTVRNGVAVLVRRAHA